MSSNSADHHASSTTKCCYSAVLRRLLCSGSLPTHPSDQFDHPKAEPCFKPEENAKQGVISSTNPGVVARLMGLDSFPNTTSPARKDKSLGSFFRSRSVNSIDFVSHFEPVNKQHRRVRTSVSFREGINYHRDYCVSLVSNLEKVDEIGEEREKRSKEKRGGIRNSERLGEKKVINEKQRKSGCVDLSQKKDVHGRKKRESLKEKRAVIKTVKSKDEIYMPSKGLKKRQKNKNLDYKVHPEKIIAPGVGGRVSSSRSSKIGNAHCHSVEVRAISTKGKKEKKMKNNKERMCYEKRMVERVCGVAGESVDEDWVLKVDDLEEICKQLGQEILQVLLRQFVDELLVRPTLWDEE